MVSLDLLEKHKISDEIQKVAQEESVSREFLLSQIALGTVVIPKNNSRRLEKPVGIGRGLRTKINANIGTSPEKVSIAEEKKKLLAALKAGTDTVMDLSIGGRINGIRKMVLDNSPVAVGTVPIYQTICETVAKGRDIAGMDPNHMFDVIEQQAQEGVDFMTVHCGVTIETLNVLEHSNRLVGIVSRGGSFHAKWIKANKKENPLYEQFARLLKLASKYGVTLSLGDGLRPGCIADASDKAQISEVSVLGKLVLLARKARVSVIVEGPGHMPLDQIQTNVQLMKYLTHDAPIYLLGPLVTDIAAGYDHITAAIGGAVAASYGADFLCYVTPSEHLRLPGPKEVYAGVIASRIACHAADIVKKVPGAMQRDNELSKYRKALDWGKQQKLALDPRKFRAERKKHLPKEKDVCTMCGKFCAMKE